MAKSKPDKRNQKRKKSKPNSVTGTAVSPELAQPLLEQATLLLQTGQADEALQIARKALKCVETPDILPVTQLPILELLGEIYVELGDQDAARESFAKAASLDPDGELPDEAGGGADKFLWLAQLSEEGGRESMGWFDKAFTVLRREIGTMEDEANSTMLDEQETAILDTKKNKLANALCGAAEVYMTDLSWDEDAEVRCERFVTEACLVAPDSPEPLQTLASVRISQGKMEDARASLQRSLDMWSELPLDHTDVPDFPTRISLARLLMDAEMEERATDVLERLVAEDDSSVEAWYLGGWCLHLLGEKQERISKGSDKTDEDDAEECLDLMKNSRKWLLHSLRLFGLLEYEDDRLREHAAELVQALNARLGPPIEDEQGDVDDWEDETDEEIDDEEMAAT